MGSRVARHLLRGARGDDLTAERRNMYFDPVYFVFIIPALLLSLWASFKTKSAFNKYSRVPTATGQTGADAAARLLVFFTDAPPSQGQDVPGRLEKAMRRVAATPHTRPQRYGRQTPAKANASAGNWREGAGRSSPGHST